MKRRNFLGTTLGTAVAAGALIPVINLPVFAADNVPLDDPAAKALQYTEDATTANRTDKMGTAAADQFCDNCRFYMNPADGRGACMLFQNRLVPAKGWCAGWVPVQG